MARSDKPRKGKSLNYKHIDVPFELRHTCFYCGDPSDTLDHFPPISRYHDYLGIYDSHPAVVVPSCIECNLLLVDSLQGDIYERFDEAKVRLTKRLAKYLKYSSVWDNDSLADAEFTGSFRKFADNIIIEASLVKERLEWDHWPITVNGESIYEIRRTESLALDNIKFKRYDHLLEYVKKVHKVPTLYFEKVVEIVGLGKLQFALHYCKSHKPSNAKQMEEYLEELRD